jgi:Mrp family chromosome partitioning ATPase
LTHTLASQGYAVGLLDVDLCGPSAPRMVLGDAYQTATVTKSASGAWIPVYSNTHPNLACMSISFLLQDHDSAVVWRGTKGRRVLCWELFVLSKQQEKNKNTDTFCFTLYRAS